MDDQTRYEESVSKRERRWDLIETGLYVGIFLLAFVLLVICHALSDSISFSAYEPGVRYPLPLEVK